MPLSRLLWYGMAWHGMVCYGMVYGTVYRVFFLWPGACFKLLYLLEIRRKLEIAVIDENKETLTKDTK